MGRRILVILGCLLHLIVSVTAAFPYDEIEVPDGGTIIGHVKFVGTPPKLEPIKVPKDANICGNTIPAEALVVSANGRGVKYAVAYLEGITKGKKIERKKITDLNQEKCIFKPHVFILIKGTDLAIKNSDSILHNANLDINGRLLFNFAQPLQNQVITKRVRKIGHGVVTCDSHPHMRGYFLVFDHPYHAISDEDGNFTMDNIPPGKYNLKLWHESWQLTGQDEDGRLLYGEPVILTKEVEIPAKGIVHVNFELK